MRQDVYIDLELFDIAYILTIMAGFGMAFYLFKRHINKTVVKEMQEQAGIILHRINDLDNAIADLQRDLYEEEEKENNVHVKVSFDEKDDKEDNSEEV